MSAIPVQPHPVKQPKPAVPPLENGDHLTRAEFERRYQTMPKVNKAELIEGVVYMPSPVRLHRHGKPHMILSSWLVNYISKTPGLDAFGDNATVRLDEINEPQPDPLLALPASAGGKSRITEDDYLEGAPELVCEVAASSTSIDLHFKLNAYRRNGVREYLVWRTQDEAVDWFALRDGQFLSIAASDGVIKSGVFPGLWLDTAALLRNDLPAIFAAIDRGTATPEHASFLTLLHKK
jgi:Uma2 family endonuclease